MRNDVDVPMVRPLGPSAAVGQSRPGRQGLVPPETAKRPPS